MHWTDKLERRFGHIAIPQLINGILGGQLIAGVITLILNRYLPYFLDLSRVEILHGQFWRLITFLFYPSWCYSALGILNILFYWWAGTALTRAWGDFKMTLYIAMGVLGAWVCCFAFGYASASGIFLSVFFAYAWMWPDQQVLLFGLLPLKIKWLGWFELAVWLLQFLGAGLAGKLSLVLGLAGFIGFFGKEVFLWCKDTITGYKRRRDWENKFK